LNPSSTPELPHTDDNDLLNFKTGWVAEERAPDQVRHWSDGKAVVKFFNERSGPTPSHLTCMIASLSPRRVAIEFSGKTIWNGDIPAGQAAAVDVWLDASHGNNTLHFTTDSSPVKPDASSPLQVAFSAINLKITAAAK